MKKANKFSLNSTVAFQTRNMLLGFVAFAATILAAGAVKEGVDEIKMGKETYGSVMSKQDKKDVAKDVTKDALLLVASLAVVYVMCATLRRSKKYNDDAVVRVARRYITQVMKEKPELKKYAGVLRNEKALQNIAAGIANKLSLEELMAAGSTWDMYRYDDERVDNGSVGELKLKNKHLQSVVDMLNEHAQQNPQFMPYLAKLVEDSTKTFSLEQYMTQQKVR